MDELTRNARGPDGSAPEPLSLDGLARLPDTIAVPSYDRADLSPGIVHIGLGNFHRAHQAWYTHRLMQDGRARDWAILGAGVRPADADQRAALLAQDCLTTLIELDPDGRSAEVTGAMIDFLPVEPDNAALIARMADPEIRIVSLTVTEGGYFRTGDGGFDEDHDDIRHDAADPDRPRTAFGAMVAALARRRAAGHGPFTCQSCDNLQGNGDILRRTVTGLARLHDADLAGWIDANCTFPNAMVDCIVPATGEAERALARDFGVADRAPVTHEPFRQWVMEDRFCAGRPDWDQAGATFTDDVHAYEAMKLRLLNAGHQILANPGEVLGLATIADCMAHDAVGPLFRIVASREIAPHVAAVPGMTPAAYIKLTADRFANPQIRDTTRRVAFDGSARHPGFLLPVIRDALAADAPIAGLALVEAAWARMCAGLREDGTEIAPNDPHWSRLQATAQAARDQPAAWLAQRDIYGDLAGEPRLEEAFAPWLAMIWSDGMEAAIAHYLRTSAPPA
ncbi:mannitol dehydrogenase family protein [Jannaschia sp. S6380]|uniref:mannitol dehydrogenase family protein n=1 Tax=Jannaschia sp. S6380 TaxID=2926408 RepID=UPI001FF3C792|nr:mannitol dehydrogenase family protein [Jannaschia sp. S6380]MCK0168228.1 mannitol dehydrogenase family protein [Jannaschia sp. S6380]